MFTILPTTDPSTLMFEGRPEIDIAVLAPVDSSRWPFVDFYVYAPRHDNLPVDWAGGLMHLPKPMVHIGNATHTNFGYDKWGRPKGTDAAAWPRLVPRIPRLDPTQPLVYAGSPSQTRELICVTDKGNLLVKGTAVAWAEFDPWGRFIRNAEGTRPELSLRNRVTETYTATVTEVDGVITKVERL